MKAINKIAVFFSVAFQPLFMPFAGMICMLVLNSTVKENMSNEVRIYVAELTFLFTVILPAFVFLLFYKMGWVSDLNLTVRKERIVPTFLLISLFITLYWLVDETQGVLPELKTILLGSIIGTVIANIITVFWKISIHALGAFSVAGAIAGISVATHTDIPSFFYITLVIAVCVGISRLILKRHTPLQVVMGSLLGLLSTFIPGFFIE